MKFKIRYILPSNKKSAPSDTLCKSDWSLRRLSFIRDYIGIQVSVLLFVFCSISANTIDNIDIN